MKPERTDYAKAAGVHLWMIEPRSHRLRSTRAVALVLALHGPMAWNCTTLLEVADIEGMSEKTLRHLRSELAIRFSIRPANFAAAPEPPSSPQTATEPDFASMGGDGEADFFAAG